MENKEKKIFNPFEGREREDVWKEIREKAKPITREEALRRMKDTSESKKKKR